MDEANAKTVALEREVSEHRRTEAARDHAERERLFSAAVESSNDAIITKSLDGMITGWNPAAERLFGYTAAEAVGQHISIDRSARPAARSARQSAGSAAASGSSITRPCGCARTARRSKSRSAFRRSRRPRARSSAYPRSSATSPNETTQRTLQQQIEERRRIFETSQDLILVADRGCLVQVSPSCATILGYRPEEMIGLNAIEFIYPDDLENTRAEMRAARRGQRMKMSDTRFIHKDGHVVTLSWIGAWSEPVRRYFFIGRDMTESLQAQETLRESEQLARGIIDTALDAFVQIDQRGIILGLELAGRNHVRLVARGGARQEHLRIAGPKGRTGATPGGPAETSCAPGRNRSASPAARSRSRRRDGKEFTAELSITALRTPRRLRVQRVRPRPHRQDRGRGADPAGREDGSGRPAHRRHRA